MLNDIEDLIKVYPLMELANIPRNRVTEIKRHGKATDLEAKRAVEQIIKLIIRLKKIKPEHFMRAVK